MVDTPNAAQDTAQDIARDMDQDTAQDTPPDPSPLRNPGKYARVERERRWLLAAPPGPESVSVTRTVTDRYLTGTRLRLRRVELPDGATELKLTQKIPAPEPGGGAVRGLITNTYLSRAEYDVLAGLPAAVLTKTRLGVPPMGVDVFDGRLRGLVLAEAEFGTDEEARAYVPHLSCVAEVTDDPRFTGGSLVTAERRELLAWLAEFGLRPAE
ncbi:CYTH domain-containing protein [Actinacidiphila alni]|uniref:CYTH domain-containing protein n=1 Tax=Actinacidiphila alni TaxID=380248 RepID=A0A1I2IQW5_9ACTN|nr:hypothetical protein [Actinacidiphila alni]SFF44802.1 CYTH domain-containing protein [Actinacidiphila alni]